METFHQQQLAIEYRSLGVYNHLIADIEKKNSELLRKPYRASTLRASRKETFKAINKLRAEIKKVVDNPSKMP